MMEHESDFKPYGLPKVRLKVEKIKRKFNDKAMVLSYHNHCILLHPTRKIIGIIDKRFVNLNLFDKIQSVYVLSLSDTHDKGEAVKKYFFYKYNILVFIDEEQ